MLTVQQTVEFREWLTSLRDNRARARIAQRIDRLQATGNFGDAEYFNGIGELRIHYGPGYRVYFCRRDAVVIILLCGGDKSSQARDIQRALDMARKAKEE
jgi:putative addiction module killer protein